MACNSTLFTKKTSSAYPSSRAAYLLITRFSCPEMSFAITLPFCKKLICKRPQPSCLYSFKGQRLKSRLIFQYAFVITFMRGLRAPFCQLVYEAFGFTLIFSSFPRVSHFGEGYSALISYPQLFFPSFFISRQELDF
jgi:hypothetical protein